MGQFIQYTVLRVQVLILLLSLPIFSHANSKDLVINQALEKLSVKPFLTYYIDFTQDKNLVGATNSLIKWQSQMEFEQQLAAQYNHIRGYVWAKFRVKNDLPDNQRYLLHFNNPLFEVLDVYYQKSTQQEILPSHYSQIASYKTGRSRAFSQRPIPHRLYLFPLDISASEEMEIFIRFSYVGPIKIEPIIWDSQVFIAEDQTNTVRYAFEFGALFLLFCYSLATFIYTSDKNYLFFSLFVFASTLNQLSLSGYAFQYLLPNAIVFNPYAVFFFTALSCIFAIIFTDYFLKLKQRVYVIHWMAVSLIVGYCLLIIKALVFDENIINKSTMFGLYLWIGITAILGLYVAFYIWLVKKVTVARFYVMAWLSYIVVGIFIVLGRFNILDTTIDLEWSGLSTALIVSMLLLSFAVGDQLRANRRALYDSRENLTRVINSMPSLLVVVDVHLVIKSVNQSLLDRLGYKRDQLEHQSLRQLIPAQNQMDQVESILHNSLDYSGIELNYQGSNGVPLPVVFSHTKMYDNELDDIRYLCVAQDITELKKLEQERLIMQDQLAVDQRLKMIGQLASGVSHELGNILTPISGFSELLLHKPDMSDQNKIMLQHIFDAAHRGKAIVDKIVSSSKKQKQVIKLSNINLCQVVRDAVQFSQALLPTTLKITEHYHLENTSILSHSDTIHQVILNLLNNASHALEHQSDGEIRIDVKKEKAQIEPNEMYEEASEYIVITVSDNGHGMDSATQKRIFEPFFTTKDVNKGTGLGLYMIYQMLKSIGGHITVESAPHQGSTFTVLLPCQRDSKSSHTTPPALELMDNQTTLNARILYVDDDQAIIFFMQQGLTQLGYHVTPVEKAEMALELLRQDTKRFDIVVTDLVMPDMNGWQLAKEIQQLNPSLPIVFVTGGARSSDEIQAVKRQYKVLEKPVKLANLKEIIEQALSKMSDRQV